MAVDVKSRAKRYEKLDFLGEGQVRPWAGSARAVVLALAEPGHRGVSLAEARPTGASPPEKTPGHVVSSRTRVSLFLIKKKKKVGRESKTDHHMKTSHELYRFPF